MALEISNLEKERDTLKASLRTLEGEQRELEGKIKALRQREIRIKREIEALTTLIDINKPEGDESASASDDGEPKPTGD